MTFKDKTGRILPDQMLTIDRARLVKRLGRVDAQTMRAVLDILAEMFAE